MSRESAQELGTLLCGTYSSVDEAGNPTTRPEYYIAYSMNRKLQYFPDFAKAIGMQSVKTCEDARAFAVAYQQYFQAHPYFDQNLPFGPLPAPPVPTTPGVAFTSKVFNGVPVGPAAGATDLFPVVHISTKTPPNATYCNGQLIDPDAGRPLSRGLCSGTFIAKNFILTAAHCIETIALQYCPGTVQSQQWITSALWEIDFPDSNGNINAVNEGIHNGGILTIQVQATSIVNPSFSDVFVSNRVYPPVDDASSGNPNFLSPYDLALLYVPEVQYDGILPADADKSTWGIQFAHGDVDNFVNTWALGVYGYGPTAESTPPTNADVLNASFAVPPGGIGSIFPDQGSQSPGVNTVLQTRVTTSPWTSWALCRGDSGGPMVRLVGLNPDGSGPPFDPVIIGVNSAGGGKLCAMNTADGGGPGDVSRWARVDTARDWIVGVVQSYRNTAFWFPKLLPDPKIGDANSYMKLHGKSCQSACDCAATELCSNPIQESDSPFSPASGPGAQSCPSCLAPPIGSCSCVRGQCLPRPDPDAGVACDAGM